MHLSQCVAITTACRERDIRDGLHKLLSGQFQIADTCIGGSFTTDI